MIGLDLIIGKLIGDSSGSVRIMSNVLVEIESVQEVHLGTQCSFVVEEYASLHLPDGTVISGGSSPSLNLFGTLTIRDFVLGESATAIISGSLKTLSLTLKTHSTLQINGNGNLTIAGGVFRSFKVGVGAHLDLGNFNYINVDEFLMQEDSEVSFDADTNNITIICEIASIAEGATLTADSHGIVDGIGTPSDSGSGASHGGEGGVVDGLPGSTYDSTLLPTSPGSGVRGGLSGSVTRGGGVVIFQVASDLILDGTISANGEDSPGSIGGGSGGSILITVAERFAGFGNIIANGGAGIASTSGGGGGGRISVSAYDNNFYGIMATFGGNGYSNGAAGTVFIDLYFLTSYLIIDNGGIIAPGHSVHVTEPDMTIRNLIIRNSGQLRFQDPSQTVISIEEVEGDNTGMISVASNQRVSLGNRRAFTSFQRLSSAVDVEENAEIILPPMLYIAKTNLPRPAFKLAGRMSGVSEIIVGADATMLIERTADTADINDTLDYIYINPPGYFSFNSLQVNGRGTLQFDYSTEEPIQLELLTQMRVGYYGVVQAAWLDITADSVEVEFGGAISSNGGGHGPGDGLCPGQEDSDGGSGACHGGAGGESSSGAITTQLAVGSLYGTMELGSGGGNSSSGIGGTGGGLITITTENFTRVDGTISASGLAGSGKSGGGSGGGIVVKTQDLTGSGAFSVSGGSGGETGGGGGGGGRITVFVFAPSKFTGTFVTNGGSASNDNHAGSAGTALVQTSIGITTANELFISNEGANSPVPLVTFLNENLTLQTYTFTKLTLLEDVVLSVDGENATVVVDHLESDSSCSIHVPDGIVFTVEAEEATSEFHCSFEVEKNGELRLPPTVSFLGPRNKIQGILEEPFIILKFL